MNIPEWNIYPFCTIMKDIRNEGRLFTLVITLTVSLFKLMSIVFQQLHEKIPFSPDFPIIQLLFRHAYETEKELANDWSSHNRDNSSFFFLFQLCCLYTLQSAPSVKNSFQHPCVIMCDCILLVLSCIAILKMSRQLDPLFTPENLHDMHLVLVFEIQPVEEQV